MELLLLQELHGAETLEGLRALPAHEVMLWWEWIQAKARAAKKAMPQRDRFGPSTPANVPRATLTEDDKAAQSVALAAEAERLRNLHGNRPRR